MSNYLNVDIVVDEHTAETEPGAFIHHLKDEPKDGQIIEHNGRKYIIELYEGPYQVDGLGASYNAFGSLVEN